MSVTYERDDRVITIRPVGKYGVDALVRCLDEVIALEDLPEHPHLVLDVRRSQSVLRRGVGELRQVTAHFGQHAGLFGRRVALLVDGGARYGLMRMAAAWSGLYGVDARVFRSEANARAWLLGEEPPARP